MINGKTVVYCGGSFDLVHPSHIKMLERAKSLGDILIVGLNSDEYIEKEKGHKPIMTYDQREYVIKSIRHVDLVVQQEDQDQRKRMKNLNVDIFIVADDWAGKFDYLKEDNISVVYTPYMKGISSTKIREALSLEENYGDNGIK